MLFSAKFSKLEKRYGEKAAFYIAHSSSFDKTSILFFEPKDETLLRLLNTLCEHNERLCDYEFKVTYNNYKSKTGGYRSGFRVIGYLPFNPPDKLDG